jgi:AraC-like DNA-binding protein
LAVLHLNMPDIPLSCCKRDVAWRAVSDEHIRCGFEQEKTSQSDDDQRGEVDVSFAIDQALHRHHVLPAGPDRKARMGMPFAQIVETSEIGSCSSKETFESLCMMVRAAETRRRKSRQQDDAPSSRGPLRRPAQRSGTTNRNSRNDSCTSASEYHQPPALATIAKLLEVSDRSLRRQLREQDISFRALLDELRMQIALKYLRTTRLANEDIALAIGFSDATNFRRAFRRWTNKSPSQSKIALTTK